MGNASDRPLNGKPVRIAPSLLSADFARLAEEIGRVEAGGCDLIHIDVMDGHFVRNITVGPFIVRAIRRVTNLPLDTHLMIENPENYIQSFVDAGSDIVTVHAEACQTNLERVIGQIHALKVSCGVSLKPATGLGEIKKLLNQIDVVLLMTVNPGFGGQAFMREVLPKIEELRRMYDGDIEVDGGINPETSKEVIRAGANILVAGTAVFGKPDAKRAMEELRWHS